LIAILFGETFIFGPTRIPALMSSIY
jgi:hypothetical protein